MLTLACSTAAQDSGPGETAGQSSTATATATEAASATDTSLSDTDPQVTTSGSGTTDNGTTQGLTTGLTTTGTGPGTTGTDPTAPGSTTEFVTTGESTTTGSTTTGSQTSTDSSTTGSPLEGECEVDADCKLSTDCCECYGLPAGEEEVPTCDVQCLQSKCDEVGIDQAVCRFGQCTTEKLDCTGPVACDALPPNCPEGTLPGVDDSCWTGGCVPAASCDSVPACALCPESTMCVANQAQLTTYVCEPVPAGCGGKPSCECAGEACVGPFDTCVEAVQPADLTCSCIVC